MKRIVPLCAVLMVCASVSIAGYTDGFITAGEYESGVEWFSGTLVVNGGGADSINVWSPARLEVWSTSTPLGLDVGGIMDIDMGRTSHLEYFGGQTQEITVRLDATANLYGGRIDGLTSFQTVQWWYGDPVGHVNIYCQPGWSWILNGQQKIGVTGLWRDNTPFNIDFLDRTSYGADPVWMNVEVITPEPATLLLLGLGSLLIRRRM